MMRELQGWARHVRYTVADIEPLIEWSIEYESSGPLFLRTLSAMSLLSGIRYGRPVDEQKFIKFAVNDMEIDEILADALYRSWVTYPVEGVWARGIAVNVKSMTSALSQLVSLRSRDIIDIDVVKLARRYLSTVENIELTAEDDYRE